MRHTPSRSPDVRPSTTTWPLRSDRILESPPPQAASSRDDRAAASSQRGWVGAGTRTCMKRLRAMNEEVRTVGGGPEENRTADRKSTRLNSSHLVISYAVFCLKKKKKNKI